MINPPKLASILDKLAAPAVLPPSIEAAEITGGAWAAQSVRRLSLDSVRLINPDVTSAQLRDGGWADVQLKTGLLAGANLAGTTWRRVELDEVRADGLILSETAARDITIRGSKLNLANFRFAKWTNVAFIDCNLREADFMGAQLTKVMFENCDLTGSQFSAATCHEVDLRGSQLADINGLPGLAGTTMSGAQIMTLAPELAQALGITIQN
jgi:uncharacterized protein YjbI with pentapeptide repeats